MTIPTKLAIVGLGALALGACSGGPARIKATAAPPVAAASSETDAVLDLLLQGKEAPARKKLKAILKRDPMNAAALMLTESIDRDPKQLLGPQNYPYVVAPGDTMAGLAQRFLGNRLKAYQLIRYNALKAPVTLAPSQVLRIPGEPPRVEPVRVEPVRRSELTPVRPAPSASKPKPAVAAPKPAAPAAFVGNPAAARQLRTAGLAALNQGNVDRAVGLLRRAAQLDPGNPAMARDLARAERIAATVRARK
jgi:LysM repeat protein